MAVQLAGETKPVYRFPTVPKSESTQTEWTDEDWMEWQANNVAPRILMPIETVGTVYEKMAAESLKNAFVAKGWSPPSIGMDHRASCRLLYGFKTGCRNQAEGAGLSLLNEIAALQKCSDPIKLDLTGSSHYLLLPFFLLRHDVNGNLLG